MTAEIPSPREVGRRPSDRHPDISYGEILDRDSREAPDLLYEQQTPILATNRIPVERYFDPVYFAKEARHLWLRVWQIACREEEIPNPGDFTIYENVGRSLIITRQSEGGIKAFFNSCPHRGRKLVTEDGCKSRFACPYHGLTWNRDGSFHSNPMAFDFPQWRDAQPVLPEAKVATWAGWVFVNFDPEAPPLTDILGSMPAHFERWAADDRYVSVHVSKVIPANWKVTAEAFMESHHTVTTHPQILPYMSDVNSQYDQIDEYVTRQFTAQLVPSPMAGKEYSEDEIVRAMLGVGSRLKGAVGEDVMTVPEGLTARSYVAGMMREIYGSEDGHDYGDCSDAEMVDALLYNVFPHMSFWGGAMPSLNYVWRPNGFDPASSIMDIYILRRIPKGQSRPAPAKCLRIPIDRSFGDAAAEAGMSPGLAHIFDQDMKNLPHVQTGLLSSGTGYINLGQYSEMRIRHLHETIDRFIAEGEAGEQ